MAEDGGSGLGAGAVEALADLVAESAFHAARGDRPPSAEYRGSPEQIWEVLAAELMPRVTREYHGFDDMSLCHRAGVPDRVLARGASAMRALADRGVRVHQLSTAAGVASDPPDCPALMWRTGGYARVVDELPFKACLFDRTLAVIPLDLAVLSNGMMIVTDPVVVDALARLHRVLWRDGRLVDLSGPPPHLVAVLGALVSGRVDTRAAESLGLSPRTYCRRVTELLDVLGVTSRFQAGAEAARRGWLGPGHSVPSAHPPVARHRGAGGSEPGIRVAG